MLDILIAIQCKLIGDFNGTCSVYYRTVSQLAIFVVPPGKHAMLTGDEMVMGCTCADVCDGLLWYETKRSGDICRFIFVLSRAVSELTMIVLSPGEYIIE